MKSTDKDTTLAGSQENLNAAAAKLQNIGDFGGPGRGQFVQTGEALFGDPNSQEFKTNAEHVKDELGKLGIEIDYDTKIGGH